MDELLKELLTYGLIPTFLFIVVILIVAVPERAEKLKALILSPFYKIFKLFSKGYISSKVSSSVNYFIKNSIIPNLIDQTEYNIKVKWVKESEDPIFSNEGTLILRLREDNDQAKNILNAAQFTFPKIICPLMRHNMNYTCRKSIDLTMLKKLSIKIGRHGKLIYKKYFEEPETCSDEKIGELITKLVELDKHGFFIPILLNELTLIGEDLFANSDIKDYSHEVEGFIEFLLTIAQRGISENIKLNYINPPFKVGSILLAKSYKVELEGLGPYLKRLRIKLAKGCESIYFIAFPNAFEFFDEVMNAVDSNERINIDKIINVNNKRDLLLEKQDSLKIAVLSSNKIYSDDSFKEKIQNFNLNVGDKIKGIVENISTNEAIINVLGIRAYIHKNDCSWLSNNNCSDYFEMNKEYDFQIKSIKNDICSIYLTRQFHEDDPWVKKDVPNEGELISLKILTKGYEQLYCTYNKTLEVIIPISEISWFTPTDDFVESLVNKTVTAKVINKDLDKRIIYASIRKCEEDPWSEIHRLLPKGSEYNGKVRDIKDNYILVDIGNGINGIIPKQYLIKAGFEYSDHKKNIVLDQGIEVVISKVFISKRKIRLDLKRNVATS